LRGAYTRDRSPERRRGGFSTRFSSVSTRASIIATRDVHRRAEHLLLALEGTSLRAADALHLALATSGRAASLATFDTRLAAAARARGLAVYPA
jgi:predicted nucleic acid-binding protein